MRKLVFIFLTFLLVVGAVNSAFGKSEKKDIKTYYEEVCVSAGESYWDIAGRYSYDGMTKAEYVKYIQEFNNAANDNILAGQKIIVPVMKYV